MHFLKGMTLEGTGSRRARCMNSRRSCAHRQGDQPKGYPPPLIAASLISTDDIKPSNICRPRKPPTGTRQESLTRCPDRPTRRTAHQPGRYSILSAPPGVHYAAQTRTRADDSMKSCDIFSSAAPLSVADAEKLPFAAHRTRWSMLLSITPRAACRMAEAQ